MLLKDEVDLLKRVPLFAKMEPAKLKLLAFTSDRMCFQPQQVLFHQGDDGDAAYVIMKGEVDIVAETPNGDIPLARVGENAIVGEIAILCEVPRTATVKAFTRIDTLRIEAGRPAFGVDMDTETIPLEAGIEGRAISYTKGCYVGQEVIVRVTTRGHGRVARRLVGLVVEGDRVPARGETLRAGGREVGHVTSATWSPALGRPIALGYVQRDFTAPGTAVAVGEDATAAAVTPLPFRP